jgi:hypothetical protein
VKPLRKALGAADYDHPMSTAVPPNG